MSESVPEIRIDMDKKCSTCGVGGAANGGRCLKCVTAEIEAKAKSSPQLNKLNFEIAKLASKANDASAALRGILVRPDMTVVTNGQILLQMTGFEAKEKPLPFPDVTPESSFAQFILPADEALILAKTFKPSNNEVLVSGKGDENRMVALGLRQAGSEKVFRVAPGAGEYPQYSALIPEVGRGETCVILNLDLLIPLLQQMAKLSGHCELRVYGPEDPIRIDVRDEESNQSAIGLVMPMRG